ncbi:MAG: hypothetical protein ACUVSX_03910 [Aggregatilineales bacterium]
MRKLVVTLVLLSLVFLFVVPSFALGGGPVATGDISNAAAQAVDARCPGSLAPRLTVGGTGVIAQRFSSLRTAPGGPAFRIVYAPATFRVLAGPVCAGGAVPLNFWQIDYGGGLVGWAVESQVVSEFGVNQYWLAPAAAPTAVPLTPTALPLTVVPPTAAPGTCAGSLPPRLTVGRPGSIAQRFSSLRTAPGGPAFRIVYAPATFTVVGGPVCAGDLLFWEIDYGGGLRGWALESQVVSEFGLNQYWLRP